tara:strand:+ start:739 stop:1041 length:303 start_codon:yes stop_codon:yes gene_type:complete
MEFESIEAAALGAVIICLRLLERTIDKRSSSSTSSKTEVRLSLAEQKLDELSEKLDTMNNRVTEALKLLYEFRESYRIDRAKQEAAEELRRRGSNGHARE